MKTILSIAALFACAVLALAADKPLDLTGAGPDSFKTNLGKVVALRGRLEQGMQGYCLFDATPTNVVFYVKPDMPPAGIFTYPTSWERLLHMQVKVTGELMFRSFTRSGPPDTLRQIPPDYYYIVLQRATIEILDSK